MTTAPLPDAPLTALLGTVVALLAAGAQVLAAFSHWRPTTAETDAGAVALDVPLVSSEASPVSFGAALLVLAALPALAALVTARGWPRGVSALATAALVLWWVSLGPVGAVATGVWLAAGAVCAHLVAAALAP